MVLQANKHRSDVEFEIGQWVFVRLQPFRQSTVRNQRSHKLARRYYGPFQITERIGKVAYRLALPETSRIHNVFHVSILKKCNALPPFDPPIWPDAFHEGHPSATPDRVLGRRVIVRNAAEVPQLLVKWKDQGTDEATWEDWASFKDDFPTFVLGDEAVSQGGGVLMHLCIHRGAGEARGRGGKPEDIHLMGVTQGRHVMGRDNEQQISTVLQYWKSVEFHGRMTCGIQ